MPSNLPTILLLEFILLGKLLLGKLLEFMPAFKVASTFILAFIEGVFMPLNRQYFFYTNFHENSGK